MAHVSNGLRRLVSLRLTLPQLEEGEMPRATTAKPGHFQKRNHATIRVEAER
jgi:hypothetical protein